MTDEERNNQSQNPEIATWTLLSSPELRVSDLEINRVYVLHIPQHIVLLDYMGIVHTLHSPQHLVSLHYMGIVYTLHPKTLNVVRAHHFYGPRDNVSVFLTVQQDGALEDMLGNHIEVRKHARLDA